MFRRYRSLRQRWGALIHMRKQEQAVMIEVAQRRILHFAGRALAALVMIVLLVSALGKLVDLGAFRASLDSWTLIPERLFAPMTIAVPLIELMVATAWIVGLHRRAASWFAAGMIVTFTATYAAHLQWASPPECNCFGLIVSYEGGQMLSKNLLARNTVLLGMLAVAGILSFVQQMLVRKQPTTKRTEVRCASASGFTLLELLLVIALIAILIGIILPHLAGARDVARSVNALSMVRGHGQVMQVYSVDYAGYYPVVLHRDEPTTLRAGGREFVAGSYWHADFMWRYALVDQYYDGMIAHGSFFPPGATFGGDSGTAFRYTESFLAIADFWDTTTRTDRSQWRAVPAANTAYPSKKGLVTSWANQQPVPGQVGSYWTPQNMTQDTAFADGSAKSVKTSDFLPWMQTGEGDYPGRVTTPFGWPVLHTLHGAQGRDVK